MFSMKNTTAMADYELRHIEALRKDLAGCTVLLKKDGSFPLEKPCTLAAYGSGVRRTIRGGTGSGEVNSRYIVTIEEGLQQAGFTLTGMEWHTWVELISVDTERKSLKFGNMFLQLLEVEAFQGAGFCILYHSDSSTGVY